MIKVVKEFTFDAAHFLPNYDGPCCNMHGHTYKLQIGLAGEVGADGFVVDFSYLKKIVDMFIIKEVDHQLLNEIIGQDFPAENPTTENMVLWIVKRMVPFTGESGANLVLVRLWETPTSYAEWTA